MTARVVPRDNSITNKPVFFGTQACMLWAQHILLTNGLAVSSPLFVNQAALSFQRHPNLELHR